MAILQNFPPGHTHLYGVVEYFGSGVQDQVLERCDLGLLPSAEAPVVEHFHHVVGEELAEAHLIRIGLGLQLVRGGQSHGQVAVLWSDRLWVNSW